MFSLRQKRITPAGGGGPAGVIYDDRQLGGGVLPVVSEGRWEEECAAPNFMSRASRRADLFSVMTGSGWSWPLTNRVAFAVPHVSRVEFNIGSPD